MAGGAEDLCLSCGLCCNGSLFWAVHVEEGEVVPVPLDPERRLRQPCACFNGACTIYPDRPSSCRKFNCRVLLQVQAGRRDRAWADAQIAAMREVLADLEVALPGGERSVYRRVAEFCEANKARFRDPAFQARHRALLRTIAAYERVLARFHVRAKGDAGVAPGQE